MKRSVLKCASFAATLAIGASAQANTIFSDFGPGGAFDTITSEVVSGPTGFFAGTQTPAWAFTSGGDYAVGQIDLALSNFAGTNSAVVSLWTDVGGALGTELGSWAVSGQPSDSTPLTSINGITGVNLTSGDSYFVQVEAGASDTFDGWSLNTQGYVSDFANNGFSGAQNTAGAFDVLSPSAAAPEPNAWALMIVGTFGTGALLRTRRRKLAPAA